MELNRSFLNGRMWMLATALFYFILPRVMAQSTTAQPATTKIKVDQVGYLVNAPKLALVTVPGSHPLSFSVKRASDNGIALQGNLSAAVHDASTGDEVEAADFSGLREPGRYYLDVPGVGRSWNFLIDSNVYLPAYRLAMLGFYGQRCGTEIDLGSDFPGYKHPGCHLKGEFHSSSGKSGKRDNVGGWHDAGDYGRYVVNSGISTGSLLWAWEFFGPKL